MLVSRDVARSEPLATDSAGLAEHLRRLRGQRRPAVGRHRLGVGPGDLERDLGAGSLKTRVARGPELFRRTRVARLAGRPAPAIAPGRLCPGSPRCRRPTSARGCTTGPGWGTHPPGAPALRRHRSAARAAAISGLASSASRRAWSSVNADCCSPPSCCERTGKAERGSTSRATSKDRMGSPVPGCLRTCLVPRATLLETTDVLRLTNGEAGRAYGSTRVGSGDGGSADRGRRRAGWTSRADRAVNGDAAAKRGQGRQLERHYVGDQEHEMKPGLGRTHRGQVQMRMLVIPDRPGRARAGHSTREFPPRRDRARVRPARATCDEPGSATTGPVP